MLTGISHRSPRKKVQCRKAMVTYIRRWRGLYLPAPKATAAGARKEMRDMKKSAAKIIKILGKLNPRAQDVLPESNRNITSATLAEFSGEVERAIQNVERPKGGAEPARKTRYLAYFCAELFEAYRPGEAKPALEGDFHAFAKIMYEIAYGKVQAGKDIERAVKWACQMYSIFGGELRDMREIEAFDAAARKIQSTAGRKRK